MICNMTFLDLDLTLTQTSERGGSRRDLVGAPKEADQKMVQNLVQLHRIWCTDYLDSGALAVFGVLA